jgi:hypothetical protein
MVRCDGGYFRGRGNDQNCTVVGESPHLTYLREVISSDPRDPAERASGRHDKGFRSIAVEKSPYTHLRGTRPRPGSMSEIACLQHL